jgi:hypothetical protein
MGIVLGEGRLFGHLWRNGCRSGRPPSAGRRNCCLCYKEMKLWIRPVEDCNNEIQRHRFRFVSQYNHARLLCCGDSRATIRASHLDIPDPWHKVDIYIYLLVVARPCNYISLNGYKLSVFEFNSLRKLQNIVIYYNPLYMYSL